MKEIKILHDDMGIAPDGDVALGVTKCRDDMFVGTPGADQLIERKIALVVISALVSGNLAWRPDPRNTNQPDSRNIDSELQYGVPAIVRRLAELGLLTPDEIKTSPTLNAVARKEAAKRHAEAEARRNRVADAARAAEVAAQDAARAAKVAQIAAGDAVKE